MPRHHSAALREVDPTVCDDQMPSEPEPPIRTEKHAFTLLPGMEAMLRTILRDLRSAKERVLIETYIFEDDRMGRIVGDALIGAAKRGADVRLLYDPLGSQKCNPEYFDVLRAGGVDVRPYRPPSTALRKGSLAPRDHSRIIAIDGRGYTGGAAWADQWLPEDQGGDGWHDVCARVEGPVVEDFVRCFEQRWIEATGENEDVKDICTGDTYPDIEIVADAPRKESLVYDRHRAAFQRAKARIWIENAYFFPPPPMLHDLYEAAARGVEVKLILPGPTDLPILKRAVRSEIGDYLDHGIQVFEYRRCVMHSKFAIVDDDWCSVGTFNANPTSLGVANEFNVFVFEPRFVARLAELFAVDLEGCVPWTRAELAKRPLLGQAVDQLAADAVDVVDRVFNGGNRR